MTPVDPADDDGIYESLRSKVLGVTASDLGISGESPGGAFGLVVDVPAGKDGFATVLALCDGSASMYLSTGGGVIGAGSHETVGVALRAVLGKLDEYQSGWMPDAALSHPSRDAVKFFALTGNGVRSVSVPADAFWGRESNVLFPLIATVQDLICAIRGIRADG